MCIFFTNEISQHILLTVSLLCIGKVVFGSFHRETLFLECLVCPGFVEF